MPLPVIPVSTFAFETIVSASWTAIDPGSADFRQSLAPISLIRCLFPGPGVSLSLEPAASTAEPFTNCVACFSIVKNVEFASSDSELRRELLSKVPNEGYPWKEGISEVA